MNTGIKIKDACHAWLAQRPKIRHWLWFISLWIGGLLTVTLISYPIRFLMHQLK